ncbi:MAG TPA: hypothetical protein VN706_16400 [Gemmatimonadaceae bacterium]|nr:hypothetical protein [Gemmatimonadaceae bacterium]
MSKLDHIRRSRAVPLTLVPLLAATVGARCAGDSVAYDPCEPQSYAQVACDSAVVHHGYYYGGAWYPRVYPYAGLYYLTRYNGYVSSGGALRTISPTVYAPSRSAPAARPSVVRGGFGGIGEGHAFAGS